MYTPFYHAHKNCYRKHKKKTQEKKIIYIVNENAYLSFMIYN